MERTTLITLQSGNTRAVIDCQGAYVRELTVADKPVLYIDPEKMDISTHPCGPNYGVLSSTGGLKDNLYKIDGETYSLPPDGFLKTSKWSVVNPEKNTEKRSSLVLELLHNADSPKIEGYPFLFRYRATFDVNENGLKHQLTFMNTTIGKNAVVDVGYNHYFPFVNGMKIEGLEGLFYKDGTRSEKNNKQSLFKQAIVLQENADRDWLFESYSLASKTLKITYPDGKVVALQIGGEKNNMPLQQIVLSTAPSDGNFLNIAELAAGRNSFNNGAALQINPRQAASMSFLLQISTIQVSSEKTKSPSLFSKIFSKK